MRTPTPKIIMLALVGLMLLTLLAACGNTSNPTSQAVVAPTSAATTVQAATPTSAPTIASPTPTIAESTPTALPIAQPTVAPTAAPAPTFTSAPPAASPTPIPDTGIYPIHLRIPAIGVDAKIEWVGKTADGAMDVPKNVFDVAWYDRGIKPGDAGNAVIDGHLDGYNIPAAVFINLDRLQNGNKIYLNDDKGKQLIFEVYAKQEYPYNSAPIEKIFGSAFEPHLNLITCNGSWDAGKQTYNQRLVIFTREVNN